MILFKTTKVNVNNKDYPTLIKIYIIYKSKIYLIVIFSIKLRK